MGPFRSVRTSQPQGPIAVSPYAIESLSLTEVWSGSNPAKTLLKNFTTVAYNGATVGIPTSQGLAASFGGTSGRRLSIASSVDSLFSTTAGTIALVRRCQTAGLFNSYAFGYNAGNEDRVLTSVPWGDGTIYWDFGGVGRRLNLPYTKDTGWETLVFVAGPTKGMEVWRRGVKLAGNTSLTSARPSNTGPFFIGAGNSIDIADDSNVTLFITSDGQWSDAQISSWFRNPWQIFAPQSRQIWVPTAVTITRPSSDILTSGWTGTPDSTNLFNNLDEVTSSDTDYITSPTITGGENTIMGLSGTLATGTWDVRYRANFVGSSAQVRIHLLDGSNAAVGVSGWQTVTSSFADYTAQVTTSGAAVRVKVEVQ